MHTRGALNKDCILLLVSPVFGQLRGSASTSGVRYVVQNKFSVKRMRVRR